MDDDLTSKLINKLDRGGLHYPKEIFVTVVMYSFIVMDKLTNGDFENKFLNVGNQRDVAVSLIKLNLDAQEFPFWDSCENGHKSSQVLEMIVFSSTNALLNNYCKNKNNSFNSKANVKKLSTLQK